MPPKAIDIDAAIAPLPVLKNRTPDTEGPEVAGAFAMLAETETGGVFAGSFEGVSQWERHPNGDELVQVLSGETQLTIKMDDGDYILHMKAGMITIVPRGCWHQFEAPNGVSVMTMTPQPTEHSKTLPSASTG